MSLSATSKARASEVRRTGARRAGFCARVVPLLAAIVVLLAAGAASTARAQVIRSFTQRNPTTNVRGNIVLVGNTLLTCRSQGNNGCTAAQNGSGNNTSFTMQFVDTDGVSATTNSSSATLTLPAGSSVLWAGLYWGARSTTATRNQIKFRAGAGAYTTLTATQLDTNTVAGASAPDAYQGYANVTAQVQASGSATYWAADITATTGADTTVGYYGGWSLVVVYQDNNQPLRNLTVFDGFASVSNGNNVTTTVSGFRTPLSGTFNTYLGAVAYEGDEGITGDSFRLNATTVSNGLNPATNFFNGSITTLNTQFTAKNPNYSNQFGYDIDTLDASGILPNNSTSATLTFNSTGDLYFPGVLTFAVDVFLPQVDGNVTKTVSDLNGGSVRPDDVLEYTIMVSNTGNDGASNNVLRDPIPTNTTYVANSLQITSGANAGAKTDAAADDQAEYDGVAKQVVFRLGTGATAGAGGTLAPGAATTIKFSVKVNAGTLNNTVVSNQATINYNAQSVGTAYTSQSDGDLTTAGVQPTDVIVVSAPKIDLVKRCTSPANCETQPQPPGTDLIYTITFTNSGGAPASTLNIVDIIPHTVNNAAMTVTKTTEFKVNSLTFDPGDTGLAANAWTPKYYNDAIGYPLPPTPWAPTSNYTPTGTYDPAVSYVAWQITGNIPAGKSGSVTFTVRIK